MHRSTPKMSCYRAKKLYVPFFRWRSTTLTPDTVFVKDVYLQGGTRILARKITQFTPNLRHSFLPYCAEKRSQRIRFSSKQKIKFTARCARLDLLCQVDCVAACCRTTSACSHRGIEILMDGGCHVWSSQ